MKKLFSFFFLTLFIAGSVATMSLAQRQTGTPGTVTSGSSSTQTGTPGTISPEDCNTPRGNAPRTGTGNSGEASGFELNVKLCNPLKVNTIQEAVQKFMAAIIKIAIPFIVVFFIWSGFNFILAQGNPTKLKQAKNMFLNTVIGTLLILGAWAITNAIIGTVNTLTG